MLGPSLTTPSAHRKQSPRIGELRTILSGSPIPHKISNVRNTFVDVRDIAELVLKSVEKNLQTVGSRERYLAVAQINTTLQRMADVLRERLPERRDEICASPETHPSRRRILYHDARKAMDLLGRPWIGFEQSLIETARQQLAVVDKENSERKRMALEKRQHDRIQRMKLKQLQRRQTQEGKGDTKLLQENHKQGMDGEGSKQPQPARWKLRKIPIRSTAPGQDQQERKQGNRNKFYEVTSKQHQDAQRQKQNGKDPKQPQAPQKVLELTEKGKGMKQPRGGSGGFRWDQFNSGFPWDNLERIM